MTRFVEPPASMRVSAAFVPRIATPGLSLNARGNVSVVRVYVPASTWMRVLACAVASALVTDRNACAGLVPTFSVSLPVVETYRSGYGKAKPSP